MFGQNMYIFSLWKGFYFILMGTEQDVKSAMIWATRAFFEEWWKTIGLKKSISYQTVSNLQLTCKLFRH